MSDVGRLERVEIDSTAVLAYSTARSRHDEKNEGKAREVVRIKSCQQATPTAGKETRLALVL